MQTFLPYPDFLESAICLDRQRLGKQRVETLQILQALNGRTSRWRNHPAVRMWDGFTEALIEYGCEICDEWIRRGYRDTCRGKIVRFSWGGEIVYPDWFSDDDFHAAHRSNLLRKNPDWYSRIGWTESTDLEYVWPSQQETK